MPKKGKGKKGKKSAVAAGGPVCPPIPEPKKERHPLDPCPGKACNLEAFDETLDVQANHYPGFLKNPAVMAVAGTDDGSYESLCKLVRAGLRCAERLFIMTPWGNYVLIRGKTKTGQIFFIYDGCTCDVNIFRYYDLTCGTAGFLYFKDTEEAIRYIIHSRGVRMQQKFISKVSVKDIVDEYGSCQYKSSNKCMKFS